MESNSPLEVQPSSTTFDNSSTLKTEWVYHERYQTKQQARGDVIAWIEGWYNTRRRHSAINYLSPEAFEARMN
jgi:transposase InsO family protein